MFSVHTTSKDFKNRGFTLELHETFSVHTTPEEFKNATSRPREDHMIILTTSLSIKFLFKMFSVHMKTKKPAFSNSSVVKSVFESSVFVTVRSDGRPNCRNKKLRFQIFPCNVDADVEWFRQFFRCIMHGPSDLGSDHKSCCRSSQKNAPLQYLQGWGKLSSHFYFP